MLSESKCEKIVDMAVDCVERLKLDKSSKSGKSKNVEVEVHISSTNAATSRFANNEMTQNQVQELDSISLRVLANGSQVRLSGQDLSKDGIESLVELAYKTATRLERDPNLLSLPKPDKVKLPRFKRYDEKTADMNADERARAVKKIIETVKKEEAVAAGIVSSLDSVSAIGNSRGIFQFHRQSEIECSITALYGSATGWAKAHATKASQIDVEKLARQAAEKARMGADPQDIAPGRYLTILEPAAVLDLLAFLWWDFAATSHLDELSSLRDKLGQKVFSEKLTVRDDVHYKLQAGAPFDGEGLARQMVSLVENGVFKTIVSGRRAAAQGDFPLTNHGLVEPDSFGEMPLNIVVEGGQTSLEEMTKSVVGQKEAILLTRVWYVREVDPAKKLLTGMTRDGTFVVKNGKISHAVKNLRFNISLFDLLNNIVMLGPECRTAGEEGFPAVVPPMMVKDFNFTEVTRF